MLSISASRVCSFPSDPIHKLFGSPSRIARQWSTIVVAGEWHCARPRQRRFDCLCQTETKSPRCQSSDETLISWAATKRRCRRCKRPTSSPAHRIVETLSTEFRKARSRSFASVASRRSSSWGLSNSGQFGSTEISLQRPESSRRSRDGHFFPR